MLMYRISVYIPESYLEPVKYAMFGQGAGKIGQYDNCAWQVLGSGQFRPLKGSLPFIGKHDRLEQVNEYKVELVCDEVNIRQAIRAMLAAHPYEEPAYEIYPILSKDDL